MSSRDQRIDQSWRDNAAAWTSAVREGRIPSRRAGTDDAVITAIVQQNPKRVLDAGCGEGWLARRVAAHDIEVIGFDASRPLLDHATDAGGARFIQLGYADFIADARAVGADFDVVVFNFSLFTEDIVPTLRAARGVLRAGGTLIIQTVHPFNDAEGQPYQDGWREESFATMGTDFGTPMPWYFRTMSSWLNAVMSAGYFLTEIREPVNEATANPLSLLLIASHGAR